MASKAGKKKTKSPQIKGDSYQVFLMTGRINLPFSPIVHTWFVLNKKGDLSRWEVLLKRLNREGSYGHIHKNYRPLFNGYRVFPFGNKPRFRAKMLCKIDGELAKRMIEFIENSPETYPHRDECNGFKGPNCNTYTQWVLKHFPELDMALPWNAYGKGRDTLDTLSPALYPTIPAMFRARTQRSAEETAYMYFDSKKDVWRRRSWGGVAADVDTWRRALQSEGLKKGDCVALRVKNRYEWILFDQAAMSLGLVVVPVHYVYREDTVAYILEKTCARVLLLQDAEQLEKARNKKALPKCVQRVVVLNGSVDKDDPLAVCASDWLPKKSAQKNGGEATGVIDIEGSDAATILFTSGTTGMPKGVILSHKNILENAGAALRSEAAYSDDVFLSILPLSTVFERTVGYILPMMAGATVAFNRSLQDLREDMQYVEPSVIVAAPRLFEKLYDAVRARALKKPKMVQRMLLLTAQLGYRRFEYKQGRKRWHPSLLLVPLLRTVFARPVVRIFGRHLRLALSGGAPLTQKIAETFVGLGVPILQGYGLTEAAPVLCANTLRANKPLSAGKPLNNVEIRFSERDELLARGPNIMSGYLGDKKATENAVDPDGWLHTGDLARLDNDGFVHITGRMKEIMFLEDGSKIYPLDMEGVLSVSPLIEQVMMVGDKRPYVTALVVLTAQGKKTRTSEILQHIKHQLEEFPVYTMVRKAAIIDTEWTVENDLLTPSLKIRRTKIAEAFSREIEKMYE